MAGRAFSKFKAKHGKGVSLWDGVGFRFATLAELCFAVKVG
ncbi:hypothetical protein [Campylobacter felis]